MFFQISPVIRKKTVKPEVTEKPKEEDKVEILSLAPFTPIPKITFENVKIGTTEIRKLLIRNPTNQDITLYVKKLITEEINLVLSWQEATICKGQEVLLEMIWTPVSEEACRHSFFLSDGKKINRDVPVTFKSVALKTSNTNPVKRKTKTSLLEQQKKVKPSEIKLPLVRRSLSPQKKPSKKFSPKTRKNPAHIQQFCVDSENKENVLRPNTYNSSAASFMSPTNATFNMDQVQIEGRETYTIINQHKRDTFILKESSPLCNVSFYKDSLENSIGSPNSQIGIEHLNMVDFEKKIQLMDFTLGSNSSFASETTKFSPTIISTANKNSSANNSLQLPKLSITRLFADKNDTFTMSPIERNKSSSHEANVSSETYVNDIRANLSSETYVKANISAETYVKANVSSGTYVKDSSIGNIATLENSPVSSLPLHQKSPVFLHPRVFEFSSPVDVSSLAHPRKELSCIPEESFQNETSQSFRLGGKRRASSFSLASPPKRPYMLGENKQDWSKKGGAACRVAKKSTGLNLVQFIKDNEKLNQHTATITEHTTKTLIVQNPFLYANIIDPFMSSQLYCNEEWFVQQEERFKKWLNLLLTPPEEFTLEVERVDVSKVWQECKTREVEVVPSNEELANKYHKSVKLKNLRLQAQNLFRSKEINDVLVKLCVSIEAGKISIRQDKDFHLNLRLKSEIMSILLSYNPLWLRIGLETIFNEVIPMKSNSDVAGLTHFILERLFKDPYLLKKHKTPYSPKYSADLKKFFLKKFFALVYFLDQAKNKKLIPHDPCLFCKKSVEKESKQILFHLSREILSAVGDITKFLKCFGYVVTHVQSYIHEFDYAVKNLGVDLRDGVRLAKVMEIIQLRDDLTTKLRVPAISRLQKVHNMDVVFKSIRESGYEILYDIVAKDIVDGHREKTLSFLWQIIYKFEAPLMVKSATNIQRWYRSIPIVLKRRKLQREYEKRQQSAKMIQNWYKRHTLARKILQFADLLRKYLRHVKMNRSAVLIQSYYRMYRCQKRFELTHQTIIKLQAVSRGWLVRNRYFERIQAAKIIQKTYRRYMARNKYLKLKEATLIVQRRYRAQLARRKAHNYYKLLKKSTRRVQAIFRANRLMETQRKQFVKLRTAAIKIQSQYRMILQRRRYLELKRATIAVQRRYRATSMMKEEKVEYHCLRTATVAIQTRFRANLQMKIDHHNYQKLRTATINIQSQYRMIIARRKYVELQKATLNVQRRYRALTIMKKNRADFLTLKRATIFIQKMYRANQRMKLEWTKYQQLKIASVTIQSQYRMVIARRRYLKLQKAAVDIQRRYRALTAMKKDKRDYLSLRKATVTIQTRFRANLLMKMVRVKYHRLRSAAIKIQSQYRMITTRQKYKEFHKALIILQRRYRALKAMREKKTEFLSLKKATVWVQTRYRAKLQMNVERKRYQQLKTATVTVQSQYRMVITRRRYLELQNAAVTIQKRYRAMKALKKDKAYYTNLRTATVFIQSMVRANLKIRIVREEFQRLRTATIIIQSKYRMIRAKRRYLKLRNSVIQLQRRLRALIDMRKERSSYLATKNSAVCVQRKYRANLQMKIERQNYLKLRSASIHIQSYYRMYIARAKYLQILKAVLVTQTRYRAQKRMQRQKLDYEQLRNVTIQVQRKFRANLLSNKLRLEYLELKRVTVNVQSRLRANRLMKIEKQKYLVLRNACIKVQSWYRSILVMRVHRSNFVKLKKAALVIEQRFIAQKLMKIQRIHYQKLRKSAIVVQNQCRANKHMKIQRRQYVNLRNACVKLQTWYRSILLMRIHQNSYQKLKKAVLIIEQRYIAEKTMKVQFSQYQQLKASAVIIQKRYRALKEMRKQRVKFQKLKSAALVIQTHFKATLLMKQDRLAFRQLKSAVSFVQARFRANLLMRKERHLYLKQRTSAIKIQAWFRATIKMRQCREHYLGLKIAVSIFEDRYLAKKSMLQERRRYEELRNGVIITQRRFRAKLEMRRDKKQFCKLKETVIFVQRRFVANKLAKPIRLRYLKLRQVALIIQQHYRAQRAMRNAREEFICLKNTTMFLQKRFRENRITKQLRQHFIDLRRVAIFIQQHYRAKKLMVCQRNEYALIRKLVIFIQQRYRANKAAKYQRQYYVQLRSATVVIQRKFRIIRAEKKRLRQIKEAQCQAATKIQALWRGCKLRSSNSPKIVKIRQNSREAMVAKPTSQTLGQRCEMAIKCIIEKSSLLQILRALEDLDFITRHCRKSCMELSSILPDQLYITIQAAARSLPEMQCCNVAAFILINFCKYPPTMTRSWNPEYMDTILNVMLHWCDKEEPLFSTLCTLLWLFAHEEEWKKVILGLPNIKTRLLKIKSLVLRKQSMVAKVGKPSRAVCYFATRYSTALPTRFANWGLDYDRPNAFTNAVHAISSLVKIFGCQSP